MPRRRARWKKLYPPPGRFQYKMAAAEPEVSRGLQSRSSPMKAIQEGCTIVLLGGWNMSILTPQWISQNLLEQSNVDLEVLVTPGNQPQLRYRTNRFVLTPSTRRLTFNVLDDSDETLGGLEAVVIKLLRSLPHTPISAAGLNFKFCEDEDMVDLARLFNFGDSASLAEFGVTVSATEIQRRLETADVTLNLKLTYLPTQILFDFNYHSDITPAPDLTTVNAIQKLSNTFVLRKELSLRMLREVYHRGLNIAGG
jgi:hypothetical protein